MDANNYYPQRDGRIPALDNNENTTSGLPQEHLPTSKKHPFIEASRTVHSAIRTNGPSSVRCWVFKKKADQ